MLRTSEDRYGSALQASTPVAEVGAQMARVLHARLAHSFFGWCRCHAETPTARDAHAPAASGRGKNAGKAESDSMLRTHGNHLLRQS